MLLFSNTILDISNISSKIFVNFFSDGGIPIFAENIAG